MGFSDTPKMIQDDTSFCAEKIPVSFFWPLGSHWNLTSNDSGISMYFMDKDDISKQWLRLRLRRHPMSLSRPVSTCHLSQSTCHCRVVGPPTEVPMARLARFSAPDQSDQSKLAVFKKPSFHHFRFWNNLEMWRTVVRNKSGSIRVDQVLGFCREMVWASWSTWQSGQVHRVNHAPITWHSHDIPWHVLTRREPTVSVMSVSSSRRDWFGMFSKASPTPVLKTTETWLKPHRNLLQLVAPRCVGVPLKRPVESGAEPSWIVRRQLTIYIIWQIMTNHEDQKRRISI